MEGTQAQLCQADRELLLKLTKEILLVKTIILGARLPRFESFSLTPTSCVTLGCALIFSSENWM